MARFRTALERRWWQLTGLLVLAIYASAYPVQFLLDALRERGLLRAAVGSLLAGCGAAVVVALLRERPRGWEVALLVAAAGAYALLVRYLDILQERVHLLEYGALGGLAYGALCERWRGESGGTAADSREAEPGALGAAVAAPGAITTSRRWWRSPAPVAILVAAAAGWGDELVQALLPNRYYDLRDVLTNLEAAALLVTVLAVRRRLRAARVEGRQQPRAAQPLA